MTKLNEQTTVPLWMIIAAIPVFVSTISYTAIVSYKTNSNTESLIEVKKDQAVLKDAQNELKNSTLVFMSDIKTSLAVIQSRLDNNNARGTK